MSRRDSAVPPHSPPGYRRMRRWGLNVVAAVLPVGCCTVVVPPAEANDPAAVYVVDYGYHSSLVLPEDGDGFVEYAFGSKDWFALNRNGLLDALRVVFLPTPSTLGRRTLDGPGAAELLPLLVPSDAVHRIVVEKSRAAALAERLRQRHQARHDTRVYNPVNGMDFTDDSASYSLCHNCNHAVAEWLRELGCEVTQCALGADYVVRPR